MGYKLDPQKWQKYQDAVHIKLDEAMDDPGLVSHWREPSSTPLEAIAARKTIHKIVDQKLNQIPGSQEHIQLQNQPGHEMSRHIVHSMPLNIQKLLYSGIGFDHDKWSDMTVNDGWGKLTIPKLSASSSPDGMPDESHAAPKPQKNLYVVHNAYAGNLPEVAKTGFIAPSIAIVHKDKLFDNFGDISFLVHPNKIHPKKTPVYNDDAYTFRVKDKINVHTKHEVDKQKLEEVRREMHEHLDKLFDDPQYWAVNYGASVDEDRKKEAIKHMHSTLDGDLDQAGNHGEVPLYWRVKEDLQRSGYDINKPKDIFTGKTTKVISGKGGDWSYEWTPENEQKIVRAVRGEYKKGLAAIKGGESYSHLESAIGQGEVSSALDLYLTKQLRSFAEIREEGKKLDPEYRNASPQATYLSDEDRKLCLKAIKAGMTPSQYIAKKGLWTRKLNSTTGKTEPVRESPEYEKKVGENLDNYVNYSRNRKRDYFEAKPQRVFKLSDFEHALVPTYKVDKLKDLLAQHGVKVTPYSTEQERRQLLVELAEKNDLMLSEDDHEFEQLVKIQLEEEFEDLSKGAMARLAPFDPERFKEQKTIGVRGVEPVQKLYNRWVGGAIRQDREHLADKLTESPNVRVRSLHRLHQHTQVRRNSVSGEREFLLHRAHKPSENVSAHEGEYSNNEVSSWTPDIDAARQIQSSWELTSDSDTNYKAITSAWIPESKIHGYLPLLGSIHEGIGKPSSVVSEEKETLVAPGTYQKHNQLQKSEQQEPQECVLTIITDGAGKMLFIKRHDNHKWSVCAGHLEGSETPEEGARREILEETGLTPEYLTQIHYYANPNLYCFSAQCQGIPHGRNDPDSEGKPQWIDITRGIPANIWDNLAGPEDDTNIVRQLFDKAQFKKSEYDWLEECGFLDLSKGAMARLAPFNPDELKSKEVGLVTVGDLYGSWVGGGRGAQDRTDLANAMSRFPGAKERSLHRLHAMTDVRRNPLSGEREFLLHRTHRRSENSSVNPNEYSCDEMTSWSPSLKTMDRIQNYYGDAVDYSQRTSAWIPESKIRGLLPIMGGTWGLKKKPSALVSEERETLVAPGTYQKHVAKSDDLSKAISDLSKGIDDIPVGKRVYTTAEDKRQVGSKILGSYDYSHLLTPEQKRAGYSLKLHKIQGPVIALVSTIYHNGNRAGTVFGGMNTRVGLDNSIEAHSHLLKAHRGKGLAIKAYEALFTHAKHKEGIRTVNGWSHSEDASRVHQSLARRHGLEYNPGPKDESGWYGKYGYALKAELGLDKSEEEWELEELAKGAMQRLYPFNPAEAKASKIDKYGDLRYALDYWGGGASSENRDRLANHLPDTAKQRGLHRLHSLTQVRRNLQTGEREFLLHRAHSRQESPEGNSYVNSRHSSWTPTYSIADKFQESDSYNYPVVSSAWIPESAIRGYLPIFGSTNRWEGDKGPDSLTAREKEVIVAPGKYQRHKYDPMVAKAEDLQKHDPGELKLVHEPKGFQ